MSFSASTSKLSSAPSSLDSANRSPVAPKTSREAPPGGRGASGAARDDEDLTLEPHWLPAIDAATD
jgi:hypothetical protein